MGKKQVFEKGQKVGTCFFIKLLPTVKYVRKALFKCTCGNEFIAAIYLVKSGNTRSCGCISDAINKSGIRRRIHGESQSTHNATKENLAYVSMKDRCYNPNNDSYYRYGGRGINVCPRWLESYEDFLEDMGRSPSKKHTLDRLDNDGIYEKDNCRWVIQKVQCNNRSSNVKVCFRGEVMNMKQLAEKYNINYNSLWYRIKKTGSAEKAMSILLPTNFISHSFALN